MSSSSKTEEYKAVAQLTTELLRYEEFFDRLGNIPGEAQHYSSDDIAGELSATAQCIRDFLRIGFTIDDIHELAPALAEGYCGHRAELESHEDPDQRIDFNDLIPHTIDDITVSDK